MHGVCSEAGLGIVKLEGFGGFRHYIASTGSRVGMKNSCFRGEDMAERCEWGAEYLLMEEQLEMMQWSGGAILTELDGCEGWETGLGKIIKLSCSCPLCQILIDHRGMDLFLGSLFHSIDLCVCSYDSTTLFWLQWLYNIVWYQLLWSILVCSSFSKLLRLFRVIHSSI